MLEARNDFQIRWHTIGLQNGCQPLCIRQWKYFILFSINEQNLAVEVGEITLTRPLDTLSHRMGEGRGEGCFLYAYTA